MLCNLTSHIRDNINDLFYEKILNTCNNCRNLILKFNLCEFFIKIIIL